MIEILKYTLKIWLTTAFIPPVIFGTISLIIDPNNLSDNIAGYYWMLVVSLLASFLTWALFFIAVYNIIKSEVPVSRHKLLIQAFGLGLALATFAIFTIGLGSIYVLGDIFIWIIIAPYLICLAASTQFYQLPQLYTYHQENSTL